MKFAAVVTVSSLAVAFGQQNPLVCINASDFSSDFDFFPDKVNANIAEYWDIQYEPTYKILRDEATPAVYVLYQCGTEIPTDVVSNLSATAIAVPLLNGCAIGSNTNIPYLELLGLRTQIKGWIGYPTGNSSIASPCINQLASDGKFVAAPEPSNLTSPEVLALLALEGSGPDLIAFSGYSAAFTNVGISEYLETSASGTAEWIKFFSVFFNMEAKANEVFDEMVKRYNCVSENAQATESDSQEKPVALWAYYTNYSGADGFDINVCPNYYCDFAKACGAELKSSSDGSILINNTYDPGEPYVYMNITEFVEFGKDAEHWFYASDNWEVAYTRFKSEFDTFTSVKNNQVFDNQKNGGLDSWFENRLAEPDVLLKDFCEVVGTGSGFHNRVWFRNVFTEEIDELEECADVNAPLEAGVTECTEAPALEPVLAPSVAPVLAPVLAPSVAPSVAPALAPALAPSVAPALAPSVAPAVAPTLAPTSAPAAKSAASSAFLSVVAFTVMVLSLA